MDQLEKYRLTTPLVGGGQSDAYRVPYTIQQGDTMSSVMSKLGRTANQVYWPSDNWAAALQPGQTIYASYDPTEASKIPLNLVNQTTAPKPVEAPVIGANAFANNAAPQNTMGSTPALGTPEFTNYLIQQGKNLGMNLDQYRVPTNASSVVSSPTIKSGAGTSSFGDITGATAGTAGMSDYLTSVMAQLDTQRKQAEQNQQQSQGWLQNFLSSQPSQADTRGALESKYGVDPAGFFADQKAKVQEINSLTEQYNGIVAARDAQIAQSYDKLSTTNFVNNQIAQINRNAAPQLSALSANINAKAATLQALQGNFDKAQTYITQAVDDATADKKAKLEAFSTMYDMNRDTLNRLDTQYKQAFDTAFEIAKMDYQNDVKMKQTIAELQLKYPKVALNLNGTLDQAVTTLKNSGAVTTTPASTTFTTTQVNSGASSAGLAVADFKGLPSDVQNYYINATAGQLNAINAEFDKVKTGKLTKDALKAEIEGANAPTVVKTYLKSRADQLTTTASSPGLLQQGWDAVKGWLGL